MSYIIPDEYEIIEVFHDDLPVIISQTIDGIDLKFRFRYNESGDIYTLQILDADDNLLLAQKVTYGKDLLARLHDRYEIKTQIIPLDVGYEDSQMRNADRRVGIDTFGKNVQMVVLRG